MTDVETRLRNELVVVADAMLSDAPARQTVSSAPDGRPSTRRRVLASVALVLVVVGAGVFALSRLTPPRTVIEAAAQSERTIGLDDETFWIVTSAMEPAIPRESHVRTFELTADIVLERGDLVVIESRSGGNVSLLRRIAGLPGEDITTAEGERLLITDRGAPSPVTGRSPNEQVSDSDASGYSLLADNPAQRSEGLERYAHDEILWWAPADTSAIAPLLDSERATLAASLRSCVEVTGVDASGVDFTATTVFDDLFEVVERDAIDEPTWLEVVDCVRRHADLAR